MMLKAFAWFLFLGGIGGAMGGYGLYLGGGLLKVSSTWNDGVEALQAGIQGEVTTTNFVFKDYDLDLKYLTKDGKVVDSRSEFFRWFSGPDQGDKYTIHYLEGDPKQATLSWAYEARFHGWVFALLMLGLGALMLFAGWAVASGEWSDVTDAKRLARSGKLVAMELTDVQQVADAEGGVTVHFTFTHPKLKEPGRYVADSDAKMPWTLDDGAALLALLDDVRGEYLVLRAGGLPLSDV
jgi:hypothetical protein